MGQVDDDRYNNFYLFPSVPDPAIKRIVVWPFGMLQLVSDCVSGLILAFSLSQLRGDVLDASLAGLVQQLSASLRTDMILGEEILCIVYENLLGSGIAATGRGLRS